MNRLREQREGHAKVMEQVEDERIKLIKLNGERAEITNQQIKDLMGNIERKVQEEVESRQREQHEQKNLVEQKLVSMLEKLKADERQALEREKRLMEQVQEGLGTMNEIIKGTKE